MAIFWTPKAPGAVITYEWAPKLADGDSIDGATVLASGATIDGYSDDGNVVSVVVSGGTASETAEITASVTTSLGDTLIETIYLPIVASGSVSATALDIVSYALRKVTGIGETPTDEQAADALERLQDMLARWRSTGADVGAPHPLTLTSVLYSPDEFIGAIKSNLILELADLYPFEVGPLLMRNAMQGLAAIKNSQLPEDRSADYF